MTASIGNEQGEIVGRFGFFEVERRVTRAAGAEPHEVFVIHTSDWVVTAAVTEDGRLVLVRQYRYGVDAPTLEPAGGVIDAGETPEVAARRELREETGFGGGVLRPLGVVHPNPAVQGNRCHLFLVQGVTLEGMPASDAYEVTALVLMSRTEVEKALAEGEISHALAVVALERALKVLEKEPLQGM